MLRSLAVDGEAVVCGSCHTRWSTRTCARPPCAADTAYDPQRVKYNIRYVLTEGYRQKVPFLVVMVGCCVPAIAPRARAGAHTRRARAQISSFSWCEEDAQGAMKSPPSSHARLSA
jgi:hypothetical protein